MDSVSTLVAGYCVWSDKLLFSPPQRHFFQQTCVVFCWSDKKCIGSVGGKLNVTIAG